MSSPRSINVLIPMAGSGSRFREAGYQTPKPLIQFFGRTMIEHVVRNLSKESLGYYPKFIFVVQAAHHKDGTADLLSSIAPGCVIYQLEEITEGAACSALVARGAINNNTPLLIANSDQLVRFNKQDFGAVAEISDGFLLTTIAPPGDKFSFCRTSKESDMIVTEVAEKKIISNIANTGIYFWKKGADFVKYADQMIQKDIRTKGEFYIAPVYNEAIADEKVITHLLAEQTYFLGTPEDLKSFLSANKSWD